MTTFKGKDEMHRWLLEKEGELLEIQKEEDGDLDQTTIMLKKVDFVHHQDNDDYLSDQAFLLKGTGTIDSEEEEAPLPYSTFAIPLTDQFSVQSNANTLQIKTDRGFYSIKIK